jgi:uncharacterized Zn finger protein (UPF0148 family)
MQKGKIKHEYGQFVCPICSKTFFMKRSLECHIGGAHKKGSSKAGMVKCKKCGARLIKDANWPLWAQKQGNLICTFCKNLSNKIQYQKRKQSLVKKGMSDDSKD